MESVTHKDEGPHTQMMELPLQRVMFGVLAGCGGTQLKGTDALEIQNSKPTAATHAA
jgi:hypothetical protein